MTETSRPGATRPDPLRTSSPEAGGAEEGGRDHRAALAVLALAILLSMTPWFSASAVLPQLRTAWRLAPQDTAWITVAVQIGFVLGAVVSAVLNVPDLVNPRRVFFLSSLGAAVANALVASVESLGPGLALRGLTGFFLAGVYPPGLKILSSWFRRRRGLALGVMVGALTIGSAAPHLVNGLGSLPWQSVVLSTSVLTVAGGLLVAFVLRDGPYPFPSGSFDPAYVVRAFRNRAVRLANFGYFGHMWELYSMWAWFGTFFAAGLAEAAFEGDARLVAGVVTFAVISAGAAGAALAGALADRIGRTVVAGAALAISGTCSLVIGLSFGRPVLAVGLGLVWGFAVVADSAQFSTIVTEVGDQAYVGTALTVQLAVGFLLTTVTIRLIPTLVTAVGWRGAFAVLALGPVLGVVAMVRLHASPEARLIAQGRG